MSRPRRWLVRRTPDQFGKGHIESIPDLFRSQLLNGEALDVVEATAFDEASARLEEAEEILRWYGDGGNPPIDMWHHKELGFYTGKRAREYFKKYEVK